MFGDLFGVSASEVNRANQAHVVNYSTLAFLLLEKGLITVEELERARAQATHHVEQQWAQLRDEAAKKFDEENPGLRKVFGTLFGESVPEAQNTQ